MLIILHLTALPLSGLRSPPLLLSPDHCTHTQSHTHHAYTQDAYTGTATCRDKNTHVCRFSSARANLSSSSLEIGFSGSGADAGPGGNANALSSSSEIKRMYTGAVWEGRV